MSPFISPGSVVDTTGDGRWTPLRVTALLAQPVVGLPRDPLHLDGPIQWAAFQAALHAGAKLPPLPPGAWPHDYATPMATWTAPCTRPDPDPRALGDGGQAWGWACSAASYEAVRHDVAWVRRKPALAEMAHWTTAGRHHIGLGPRRAANVPHQAAWTCRIVWWCLADPQPLADMLRTHVTHLGKLARHGWGHVLEWTVETDEAATSKWRARDMPDADGSPASIRAPYWHDGRRMPARRGGA